MSVDMLLLDPVQTKSSTSTPARSAAVIRMTQYREEDGRSFSPLASRMERIPYRLARGGERGRPSGQCVLLQKMFENLADCVARTVKPRIFAAEIGRSNLVFKIYTGSESNTNRTSSALTFALCSPNLGEHAREPKFQRRFLPHGPN